MPAPRNPQSNRLLRLALQIAGGLAVVSIFFFGTLYVLEFGDRSARDQIRAEHARTLKQALNNFYKDKHAFPVLQDNPVDDLKAALVDGGYLKSIPNDPSRASTGFQYRYVSNGVDTYGLLFVLEKANGAIPAGGRCLAGLNTAGTEFWRQPPDCPF
jgi:hypothetical protein